MRNTSRTRSGIALILTLSIVLVVGLLVLGGSVTGVIDRTISANQFRSNAAYYEALAGIDVIKTAVFRNLVDAYANQGSWCEVPIAGGIFDPTTGSLLLERGLDRSAAGFRGTVGIGSHEVWYDIIGTYIVIESLGTVANTEARVRFVADAGSGPGTAWDNAITAQGRPTEKAIAGNAAIYGSLHIVRGDLEDDDIDGSIDLGGGAGVFSDYYGDGRGAPGGALPGDIRELVREFVQGTEFGVDVDLCARVKIARGNVYTQGNVSIGVDDLLERRQAVSLHLGRDGYVCDKNRPACSPADAVLDHNDSRKVHLRLPPVGMVSPYDPFEEITLPRLNEGAFTGDDVLRITYPDSEEDPAASCAWLYASTESPHVVRLPPESSGEGPFECSGASSSIAWVLEEGGGGHLEVTGRINIVDADVEVMSELRYRGTGSVLVGEPGTGDETQRSISVRAAVRPDVPGDYLERDGSTLALMATGDVIFDVGASARPSAALVYAGRDFVSEKQGLILGAVVAERFDFLQVPRIAYDPRIAEIADLMRLPGTAAADEEGTPQSRGVLSNILLERF